MLSCTTFAQTPTVTAIKTNTVITVDGDLNESAWLLNTSCAKKIVGKPNNTTIFGVTWNSTYLYVGIKVTDANLYNESVTNSDDDAVELFIDAENNGGTSYGINDRQFIKEWNSTAIWEKAGKTTGVLHAWKAITGGYTIELAVPWSSVAIASPAAGLIIGFDIGNDDDDNGGARNHQAMWAGNSDNYRYPSGFGDLKLAEADTLAPTAPTGLTYSGLTATTVNLSWTAATDNVAVTGYDVFRNGVKINTALVTANTYNVTGLTTATAYSFYVKARDAAGNISANSNSVNITTPDVQVPTVPTGLAASAITQNSLSLSWTAATDNVGVSGYDVYRNGTKINTAVVTGTLYNVTGLTAATNYSFYVRARDAAGNISANSNTVNVTTLATAPDTQIPSTPSNLVATGITQAGCTLTWSASTDNVGVAGYDVYRNGAKINASNITSTTYNATGLAAGYSFVFTVKARDAAGNISLASNALNVTTLAPTPGSETFTVRTVIARQRMPHDLVYGPDNNIWYIERFGGTVSFVNPATGVKKVVLTLGSKMVRTGGQDGLMGLTLHPQFNQGKPYVYISYTYQSTSNILRKTRIERYNYNAATQVLETPVTILENIPGSNDHNSARLAIGPDLKLYYTAGDMGAGQFDNLNRTQNAQNLNVLEGKVLRLNTEVIGGSWIPTDNPFTNAGAPTAVYTFGHRNPQGLVWGKVNGTDLLYSSEHGPYSDDEINVIQVGRNYGWPQVAGFCDGNYNGRNIGGFTVVNEQTNCNTLNVKEPLRSLFPVANPPAEGTNNMTWPSTAPSGTEFYGSNAIPGWQNSLLVAELKAGVVARLKLSSDGLSIISDTINYFRGKGRFRDVVVSPDGLKIYVACDSSGSTSGPTGGVTTTPANPGSILEFTYQPSGATTFALQADDIKQNELMNDRSVDVYPNPASTYFVVYNYKNTAGRTIGLFDMNGRLVKQQAVSNIATRIETSGIANGLYMLKVTDEKGKTIRMEKIIISK